MDAEPLLRYWTLQGPQGHVATCELVRTARGPEVRCDWTFDGAPAQVARTASIEAVADALALSDTWKAAYVEKGWVAHPTHRAKNEKN